MISPTHCENVWTSWQVRANCHSELLFAVAAGATGLDPETENLWIKPVSCSSFKYSPSDFVAVSLPCMNCFNLYLAYQAKYIHQSRKKVLSRYKTTFCLSVCLSGFNVFVVLYSKYLRFKGAFFSCVLLRFVHTWNLIWVSGPPLWSSGQSFWLQIQGSRVWSPALPDFLSSSGSGTGSTQPREVN
jgi:hypothetical protein